MDQVVCIRLSVGRTGLSEDTCKERLSKWLSKNASSWCIVEEFEPDNLHWQGWIKPQKEVKKMDVISNGLGYSFKDAEVKGNALLSCSRMKTDFDFVQRYTMKGREEGAPVKVITVQYFEYNDEYVQKWHVEQNYYKEKKKRVEAAGDHIVKQAIAHFKQYRFEPYTDVSSKQRDVARWLLRRNRALGKNYPGDFIFSNYVTSVLLEVDSDHEEVVLDRIVDKLNYGR